MTRLDQRVRRAANGEFTCQELEQDHTRRINIGPPIHVLFAARGLLGRHVGRHLHGRGGLESRRQF